MIHTIDLKFLDLEQTIGSFLIPSSTGPVLIETGPYSTFKHLKSGIEKLGYRLEDIKHVLITHIHLDHAGAAWAMAERGAQVYLHPFGYKHMNDPSKLVQSAKRIYQEEMDRLWSDIKAIPAQRLNTVEHEEILDFGDIQIQAWHSPGHAVHHIAWQVGEDLIAGDVAGVKIGDGPVVPPCPPPDIHIENWKKSIQLLRTLPLKRLHLSHFGVIENIEEHLDQLEEVLEDWSQWIFPHYQAQTPLDQIVPLFEKYTTDQLISKKVTGIHLKQYDYANPAWMSVAGLMRYWKKRENS